MKNARLFGFLFMLLGACFTVLLMTMNDGLGGAFRFLYIGPVLVGGGFGMLIMPGYQPTDEEWSDKTQRLPIIWNKAPMLNKIVWIGLSVIAFGIVMSGALPSI